MIFDYIWCIIYVILTKLIYVFAEQVTNTVSGKHKASKAAYIVALTSIVDIAFIIINHSVSDCIRMAIIWGILQTCLLYAIIYIRNRSLLRGLWLLCLISIILPACKLFTLPFVNAYGVSRDLSFPITLFVGLVMECSLFYVICTMQSSAALKQEIELRQQQIILMDEVRKQAEYDEQYIRSLKDKYENDLNEIYDLYQNNGDTKLCYEYIDRLEKKINISKNGKCSNSIVNAILLEKENVCLENGIDFTCDVKLGENISIENLHLCSIFNNLLNNAIEACSYITNGNKYIDVKVHTKNNYLVIIIKNSSNIKSDRRVRQKGRGYGLNILNDIAEKYDGSFRQDYRSNEYKAIFSIPM